MNSELCGNIKYTGATLLLLLLLLTGADSSLACDNGPSGATRILAGTGATVVKNAAVGDNDTYVLTIQNPDPYMSWKTDSENGAQSLSCFVDYWSATYGNDKKDAVVFGSKPSCATISSLSYTPSTGITAILQRPNQHYAAPSVSGSVVIEINRSCNPSLPCLGVSDLTGNCYLPFFSPAGTVFTASAPRATLNFSAFDNVVMPNSNLGATTLSNATFTTANLSGVNFDDAVMISTDFTGANMAGAHAHGAFVYNAIAPNGTVVNSPEALLNGAVVTTTTTTAFSNNHTSFITLTANDTADNPKTVSFVFVNNFFNDFSEVHYFIFTTVGTGTVSLTVGPETLIGPPYLLLGFIGPTWITSEILLGLLGTPLSFEAPVEAKTMPILNITNPVNYGFMMMFPMKTVVANWLLHLIDPSLSVLGGDDYPVTMNMEVYFTPATATTE